MYHAITCLTVPKLLYLWVRLTINVKVCEVRRLRLTLIKIRTRLQTTDILGFNPENDQVLFWEVKFSLYLPLSDQYIHKNYF